MIGVVVLAALVAIAFTVLARAPGNETTLRYAAIALCALGLLIAGYVAFTAVILKELPQCVGGGGGCAVVENSKYSKIAGIHISIFGLIGYMLIIVASVMKGDRARIAAFVLTLGGFGFSLYLTYLELWEILYICQWCIGSAVLMTLLFAVSSTRLFLFYGLDDYEETNGSLSDGPAGKS